MNPAACGGRRLAKAEGFQPSECSNTCVGMLEDDAKYFWDFASYGTRVVVYS
jgi:hypothetical protein